MFEGDGDHKPISIIITTLNGRASKYFWDPTTESMRGKAAVKFSQDPEAELISDVTYDRRFLYDVIRRN